MKSSQPTPRTITYVRPYSLPVAYIDLILKCPALLHHHCTSLILLLGADCCHSFERTTKLYNVEARFTRCRRCPASGHGRPRYEHRILNHVLAMDSCSIALSATRTHNQRERWVDVYTYAPFGERVFLASPVPQARISSRDILTIFPTDDAPRKPVSGMLELAPQAFTEYMELSSRTQKRHEQLFNAWSTKPRRRWLVL